MERTVHTLKKTLRLAGNRMQQKSKMSMAENTILINECNTLRRENHKLQQQIAGLKGAIRNREAAASTSALEKVRWRKLPDRMALVGLQESRRVPFDPDGLGEE